VILASKLGKWETDFYWGIFGCVGYLA